MSSETTGRAGSKIKGCAATPQNAPSPRAKKAQGKRTARERETDAFYRSAPALLETSGRSENGALAGGILDASGPNGYARLLGLEAEETGRLLQRLQDGVPFASFEALGRALALSSGELMELAGIPARTMQRRRERGRFDASEGDRLLRLARLFGLALGLFENDVQAARRWMSAPQRALNGETPLRMSRTELGAREVEVLIGRLEHGVFG